MSEEIHRQVLLIHHLVYDHENSYQHTLAIFPVGQGVLKVGDIAQCLDIMYGQNPQIEVLCLDSAFYANKVRSFLQGANVPFIMAVRRFSHRMKSLPEGVKSRF